LPVRSAIRESWSLLREGLVSFVYPPRCAACRELGRPVVCSRCIAAFTEMPDVVCRTCGMDLGDEGPLRTRSSYCRNCTDHAPHHFEWARARGRFDGTLRTCIHRLKYDGRRCVGNVIGEWLRKGVCLRPPHRPDVVAPVPLHWTRMRQRGFNQSYLIARAFVGDREWPIEPHLLRRTRRTRPQVELHADQRAANVRGAFAVSRPREVRGRRVLVVDDVVTTLSTVDECARALKEAGAAEVYVVAAAR